jgi:hypothetical protein
MGKVWERLGNEWEHVTCFGILSLEPRFNSLVTIATISGELCLSKKFRCNGLVVMSMDIDNFLGGRV